MHSHKSSSIHSSDAEKELRLCVIIDSPHFCCWTALQSLSYFGRWGLPPRSLDFLHTLPSHHPDLLNSPRFSPIEPSYADTSVPRPIPPRTRKGSGCPSRLRRNRPSPTGRPVCTCGRLQSVRRPNWYLPGVSLKVPCCHSARQEPSLPRLNPWHETV